MVSGSLALLYFLFGFHRGRQGSGPDRGRSPVEWGDFPSVRTFIRPSVRPSPPLLGHPARPQAQPARPQAQPARPQAQQARMDGRTDGCTYKISPFYRTSSPIGAAALLPKGSSRPIKSRAREPLTI